MSDPSVPPPSTPHRGLIAREELNFLPRIRWRFWAPVLAALIGFPVVWLTLRHRDLVQRREALVREYSALVTPLAPTYREARARIESSILASLGPWQGAHRDPSLTWETFTREPVLYARTRLGEIRDRDDLAASIRHRYADQLLACMGIQFAWAREFFDKGAFLLPSHLEEIRNADTPERVNALRADLLVRLQRDRDTLTQSLGLHYFVLAVDEAPLSIDGPTRVYVYDLRDGHEALRARGTGGGLTLIPFRIAGVPAPPSDAPRGRAPTVTQHDCAVANDVRAALGIPHLGMSAAPEAPTRSTSDAEIPRDAANANPPNGP